MKTSSGHIVFQAIFFIFIALPFKVYATTVTLEPTPVASAKNATTTLSLRVDNVSNLNDVGFYLTYDPRIVRYQGAADTGFLSQGGGTVVLLDATSTIATNTERLNFAFSRFESTGVSTTTGATIATLVFNTQSAGGSTALTFLNNSSRFLRDTPGADIPTTWINGLINVGPLATPTGLAAFAQDYSSISLSWASSSDVIASYQIFRNSTSTPIATTTGLSYTDNGLATSTTYSYFVKAIDAAGNFSDFATTSGTTLGDAMPPVITILAPTASASFNSSSSPITLTGTSADNLAVTAVTWSRVNGTTATGTAVGTSNWTASNISLFAGNNVISVMARDAAGNTATDTLTVSFDNTAPTITITAPTAAATLSTSSAAFTLAGTASDANGIATVTWSNNRGGSGTVVGTSSWSVAATALNLQNGSNLITVTARDTFGLISTDALTITFDNQAPTVAITGPTAAATWYASSSPTSLYGTSTDNVAVTAISLSGGTGTITGTSSWSIAGIALTGATTTLTVTARDALNNIATDTITIYLDTDTPAIPTSTPVSASAASASQINLSWPVGSDAGNSGLAGYKIYRNGTSSANLIGTSVTANYSDTGLSASTAYTYYIFAYDNAGNLSASPVSIGATTQAAPVTPPASGGGGGFSLIDTTPPARPTNFRASSSDRSVNLNWANPTDSDFAGVLILRTEATITPVCPTSAGQTTARQIYRGSAAQYSDSGLNNNLKYCYAIFSYDNQPNYSAATILTVQPGANQTIVQGTSTTQIVAGETIVATSSASTITAGNLAGLAGSLVDEISLSEGTTVFSNNQFINLSELNKKIYDKIMQQAGSGYADREKRALAYFIQHGTPNTLWLGAGERAGSVGSFAAAFGRLPGGVADWQDVVKIANGRWPKATSSKAEANAEKIFKQIYLRAPKRSTNKYDDNAIRIIAYGLRPAKRNMANEAAAMKSFKFIFKRLPTKSNDWDIVRAIAYSGAKR